MPELYLSQWRLNPRLRPVQLALADSQTLHRLVMSAFPRANAGDDARQAFGVLYRLEIDDRSGVPTLLVQSAVPPASEPLAPFLLRPPGDPKDVSRRYDAITAGSVLLFRLRANPTRRVNASQTGDRLAGKRVNLRTDEQRQDWITRKLREAGCGLLHCTIQEGGAQLGRRNGQRLHHGAVVFDGLLRVQEPDALRAALRAGIGAGKAYGFGLLSVAPGGSP